MPSMSGGRPRLKAIYKRMELVNRDGIQECRKLTGMNIQILF